jgi:antitoxin component YwqK of YwqJK toxin-antitoxin module
MFLIFQVSNSQSTIDLKFYDSCKDSIVRLNYTMYSANLSNNEFRINSKDSIKTIDPEKYIINILIQENNLDYKVFSFTKNILDKRKYIDTIQIPKVLKKLRNNGQYAHLSLGFYKCDKICDGYITDYYDNGKLRLEGYFVNGLPKREVKKYNSSGKLVEIDIYGEAGILIETIYPE